MHPRATRLSPLYLGFALLALVTCWRQNLLFMQDANVDLATGFVAFWPALLANHATTSITIDMFMLGVAVMTWMVVEARRLEVRGVWAYILLSFPIGISVMVPLFLVARERAMDRRPEPGLGLGRGDVIGLVVLIVPVLGFAIWLLGG